MRGHVLGAVVALTFSACGGPTPAPVDARPAAASGGERSAAASANTNRSASARGAATSSARAIHTRADGAIELGRGFSPSPVVMAGEAGGPTDAGALGATSGASCVGHIPTTPQHVLEITSPIPHLRIVVDTFAPSGSGSSDTVLFVRLPGGGLWCNDDGGGNLQPLVEGPVGVGRMEVFVGTYGDTGGAGARYKIGFTEDPAFTHEALRGGTPPGSSPIAPPYAGMPFDY